MAYSRTLNGVLLFLVVAAESIPTDDLAAPLLKFEPAIELTSGNRITYKLHPEVVQDEQQRNMRKQSERSISWIGLLAILGATALFLRPKKKEERKIVQAPQISSLQKLEALQHEEMDAMQLYIALTSIVRDHLEKSFPIKVTTETTEEVLQELARKPLLDESTKSDLIAFLETADAVKFGRYTPTDEERDAAIEAARKICS